MFHPSVLILTQGTIRLKSDSPDLVVERVECAAYTFIDTNPANLGHSLYFAHEQFS